MGPHVNPGWRPCQQGEVSDWLLFIGQQLMQSDCVCLEASIGQPLTNKWGCVKKIVFAYSIDEFAPFRVA